MAQKKERVLEVFYRLITGSGVSVSEMADEYEVSSKSISRDVSEVKNFIADHRDLLSNAEVKYSSSDKKYYMDSNNFFASSELFALVKMMIGSRGFSKTETLELIAKMKNFTTPREKEMLNHLISDEMYHFSEVKHDCKSVIDNLWRLTECIERRKEITISYYKMNREYVERRIRPLAITFSDYYFYLIGYQEKTHKNASSEWEIRFFRIDRIVRMVEHRGQFPVNNKEKFDEGDLMSKIQHMFPGKTRHIRFEFSGPSVQAVLDKIPTARVVEIKNGVHTIDAEVLGSGVNMFLLSQGSWVKPIAPEDFVQEMKTEVKKMLERYE